MKKKLDRKAVHAFFDSLIAGESAEESVAILKDILVEEFCFLGIDGSEPSIQLLEIDIRERMKNPANKIMCIKDVRQATGVGLAEAKAYVEAFQVGHPNYGQAPNLPPASSLQPKLTEQFLEQLANRLNDLAEKYKIDPHF